MAIQKIAIEQFLILANQYPVLDVRSPGEFLHAHIPGAYNLPLFSDDERKAVGIAYKQQSRETAIKLGLDYFGVKMKEMVEEVESLLVSHCLVTEKRHLSNDEKRATSNVVLVHCWRGGMRSAGVAWLLDLYGFKIYTLAGGYKAYRKWVLAQFEKDYAFNIIGGYTGSGKTQVLHELKKLGHTIIDLEALANHKGSAFGFMGEQPKQEMFENMLAGHLAVCSSQQVEPQQQTRNNKPQTGIFLEDESQRIGNLQIPMPLWNTMRRSPVFFLDIPFEERLNFITEEYGKQDNEQLVNAITRIQKRLGGMETKNAINYLKENNHLESFRTLLTYYDKWYGKALHNRENLASLLNNIPCNGVDTKINTINLLKCQPVNVA